MPKSITTKAQACKKTYGNHGMVPYDPERCVEGVMAECGWWVRQCSRVNGHGPDGLYCKQHAQRFSVERITLYVVNKVAIPRIEQVMASRVTDKSVWIGNRREGRDTEYDAYFDTLEGAKKYAMALIDATTGNLTARIQSLAAAKKTINNLSHKDF